MGEELLESATRHYNIARWIWGGAFYEFIVEPRDPRFGEPQQFTMDYESLGLEVHIHNYLKSDEYTITRLLEITQKMKNNYDILTQYAQEFGVQLKRDFDEELFKIKVTEHRCIHNTFRDFNCFFEEELEWDHELF